MFSYDGMASRWRELHGSDSWAGLLDPLDADLRRSLITYGEMAMATHEAFIGERRSPNAGMCRYRRADLFRRVEVSHPGWYAVTRYVYATACADVLHGETLLRPLCRDGRARECNWMGYVAAATDEGAARLGRRDIVVAWRGTLESLEWVNDLDFLPASAAPVLGPAAEEHGNAVVHHGFLTVYTASDEDSKYNKTSARDQVLEEVKRLMELHKGEVTSITLTGHSLGASLAILNAVDIVSNGLNTPSTSSSSSSQLPPCPVTAIVFACPHVGNDDFKSAFASFSDLRALHVINARDIVPLYPPIGYVDVATAALRIDTSRSPYLRSPGTPQTWHNLECYLHGVAGEQGGQGRGFRLEVDRDVALVNKGSDALKDEYPVPANWWVVSNKGMVRGAGGHWKLKDFEEI